MKSPKKEQLPTSNTLKNSDYNISTSFKSVLLNNALDSDKVDEGLKNDGESSGFSNKINKDLKIKQIN